MAKRFTGRVAPKSLLVFIVVALIASACGGNSVAESSAVVSLPEGATPLEFRLIAEGLPERVSGPVVKVVSNAESVVRIETSVESRILETVDFDDEVVVVFDWAESSSCPILPVRAVYLDGESALQALAGSGGGEDCTVTDNPYRVIVAVERSQFPEDAVIFEF